MGDKGAWVIAGKDMLCKVQILAHELIIMGVCLLPFAVLPVKNAETVHTTRELRSIENRAALSTDQENAV